MATHCEDPERLAHAEEARAALCSTATQARQLTTCLGLRQESLVEAVRKWPILGYYLDLDMLEAALQTVAEAYGDLDRLVNTVDLWSDGPKQEPNP